MDNKKLQDTVNLAFLLQGQTIFLTDEINVLQIKIGQGSKDVESQTNTIRNKQVAIDKANEDLKTLQGAFTVTQASYAGDVKTLKDKQAELNSKSDDLAKCLKELEQNNVRLPLGNQVVNKTTRM